MYLVTANCLFRRECLIEQGGFKESFFVPGGEDPELSFRLLRAGYPAGWGRTEAGDRQAAGPGTGECSLLTRHPPRVVCGL